MTRQERIQNALRANSASRAHVELRDANVQAPDSSWQKAAMGFAATAVLATASTAFHPKLAVSPGAMPPRSANNSLGFIVEGQRHETIAPMDRVRLCKTIASQHEFNTCGLDWKDLYAAAHTETGWLPRDVVGTSSKPTHGLAQVDGPSAHAMGIDPHNSKMALQVLAQLMKSTAHWSKEMGYPSHRFTVALNYRTPVAERAALNRIRHEDLPIAVQRRLSDMTQGRQLASALERTWAAQQGHVLQGLVNGAPVQKIADGSSENQRMKGLVVAALQKFNNADEDTENSRARARITGEAADGAGVRVSESSFGQSRAGVLGLIKRLKQSSADRANQGNQSAPDSDAPAFGSPEGRLYDIASMAVTLVAVGGSAMIGEFPVKKDKEKDGAAGDGEQTANAQGEPSDEEAEQAKQANSMRPRRG